MVLAGRVVLADRVVLACLAGVLVLLQIGWAWWSAKMGMKYAERNKDFIVEFFRKYDDKRVLSKEENGGSSNGGVYLFCVEQYPVYIGITGDFHTRFDQQRRNDKIISLLKKYHYLEAYEMKFPIVTAKVVESMFLAAFDFALNADENPPARDPAIPNTQNDVKYSATAFEKVFKETMKEIGSMSEQFSKII